MADDLKDRLNPDSAFGPEGVKGRDAAQRALKDEMMSIRNMKGLRRSLNRAVRRGNVSGIKNFTSAIAMMGGDPLQAQSNAIPNSDDIESQARANMPMMAQKRYEMGQNRANELAGQAGVGGQAPASGTNRQSDPPPPLQTAGGAAGSRLDAPPGTDRFDDAGSKLDKPIGIERDNPTGQAKPSSSSAIVPDASDELASQARPSFAEQDKMARERVTAEGGFGDVAKQKAFNPALDARKSFAADLERSELIRQTDEAGVAAREKAYKRADSLGITREQVQERLGIQTDAERLEEQAARKDDISRTGNKDIGVDVDSESYKSGVKAYEDMGLTREDYDKARAKASADRVQNGKNKGFLSDEELPTVADNYRKSQQVTTNNSEARNKASDEMLAGIRKDSTDIGNAEAARREEIAIFSDTKKAEIENRRIAGQAVISSQAEKNNEYFDLAGQKATVNKLGIIRDTPEKFMPEGSFSGEINKQVAARISNKDMEGKSPSEIQEMVKSKFALVAAKGEAFNLALGGKKKEAVNNYGLLETTEVRPEYTTDAFKELKRSATSGNNDPGSNGYVSSIKAMDKIANAAIDTGYPIEIDKQLMADPVFRNRLNKIKVERGVKETMDTYFKNSQSKVP